MSQFYLTLPSNSSMNIYPNNTLAKYTTRLHNDVSLQGEWEVGLSEIVFPKTWFNINENQYVRIRVYTNGHDIIEDEASVEEIDYFDRPTLFDVKIRPGYYVNVESLVFEINICLEQYYQKLLKRDHVQGSNITSAAFNRVKNEGWIKLFYNTNSNMIEVEMLPAADVILTPDLNDILGFKRNSLALRAQHILMRPDSSVMPGPLVKFTANHVADVDSGRHMMYVYCDVLERVAVGDTLAPLLRIVDINGAFGTTIHRNYERPRYVPLQKLNFESLEIDIRDAFGEPVPFESGSLIVTLHFRRARSTYFLS